MGGRAEGREEVRTVKGGSSWTVLWARMGGKEEGMDVTNHSLQNNKICHPNRGLQMGVHGWTGEVEGVRECGRCAGECERVEGQ